MVGEGASGDETSLRQGAGTELLLIPILESRRRRNKDENWETDSASRVFGRRGINRCKGGHRGWPHLARRPEGAPPPGRTRRSPGQRVAPLRLSFGLLESFGKLEFLEFFLNFLAILIFHLFLRCTDNNRQKLALGTRLIG